MTQSQRNDDTNPRPTYNPDYDGFRIVDGLLTALTLIGEHECEGKGQGLALDDDIVEVRMLLLELATKYLREVWEKVLPAGARALALIRSLDAIEIARMDRAEREAFARMCRFAAGLVDEINERRGS
jgi:hypothetical protein